MKKNHNPSCRSKLNSFTLIELLVVIAIIAILAGTIMGAATYAINAAKRVKAYNMATQIQTSVVGYYTEYSTYPLTTAQVTAGQDVFIASSDQTDWIPLAQALCGNINAFTGAATTPTVPNTRSIAFLQPMKTDMDVNGVPQNPINPYIAPANQYFNIYIDGNYDGILGNTSPLSGTLTNFAFPAMPTTNVVVQPVALVGNCNTGSGTNNTFYVRTY